MRIVTEALPGFFAAGFESASQRRRDGRRLDLLRATGHDRHAGADYRACTDLGIRSARDGLRWHLIETEAGSYDWSSWAPMVEAAAQAGVRVIWNLHHYGFPDHVDVRDADFPPRFAAFAAAAAVRQRALTGRSGWWCPVNEISFQAWAASHRYFSFPGAPGGGLVKRQLVRAAVAAVDAIRAVDPDSRFWWAEPLIHVAPRTHHAAERRRAEQNRMSQYEAFDLLTGAVEPEVGGRPDLIDVAGINFYPHNQWYNAGCTVPMGHHAYRPLADMLVELWERYRRPIYFAETGAEGSARPAWLHYVCAEARTAMAAGVPVLGICLYPVTHYPGWDNGRAVETGLFSAPDEAGARALHRPLADEMERQRGLFLPVPGRCGSSGADTR